MILKKINLEKKHKHIKMSEPKIPWELLNELLLDLDVKTLGKYCQTGKEIATFCNADFWKRKFERMIQRYPLNLQEISEKFMTTWKDKVIVLDALVNPGRVYTLSEIQTDKTGIDLLVSNWAFSQLVIYRNMIANNLIELEKCLKDNYYNRQNQLSQYINKFYNDAMDRRIAILDQSGRFTRDPVEGFLGNLINYFGVYRSTYFGISSSNMQSMTLFRYQHKSTRPTQSVITIPGTDNDDMYRIIATLLNNADILQQIWKGNEFSFDASELFLLRSEIIKNDPKLSTFTNDQDLQNYKRNKIFTKAEVMTVFTRLSEIGKIMYVIVKGPIRSCPLKEYKPPPARFPALLIFKQRQALPIPSPTPLSPPTARRVSSYQTLPPRSLSLPPPDKRLFQMQRWLPNVPQAPPPDIDNTISQIPSVSNQVRPLSTGIRSALQHRMSD